MRLALLRALEDTEVGEFLVAVFTLDTLDQDGPAIGQGARTLDRAGEVGRGYGQGEERVRTATLDLCNQLRLAPRVADFAAPGAAVQRLRDDAIGLVVDKGVLGAENGLRSPVQGELSTGDGAAASARPFPFG